MPNELVVPAGVKGKEVCSGLELSWILLLDMLPNLKMPLTLGNNRISKISLSNSPVFIVLQKPEILNQTND